MRGLRDATTWFGGARNPAFPLRLDDGAPVRFLARAQTLSLLRFPLAIYAEPAYWRHERANYIISGALLCIPVVVSIFILLLWRIQRQPGLPIVIGLILAEIPGAAWVGGLIYAIAPWIEPRLMGWIGLASWIATVTFGFAHARAFLNLDSDAPRLARAFKWLPLVFLPFIGLELAGSPWGRNLTIYATNLSLIAFFAASVWQAHRGLAFARVYALAWGTYLLSTTLIIINLLGAIPPNYSNWLLFAQGSIVSLLFAVAVVGQIRNRERRIQAELQDSKQRFALAAEGATVGLFDWEVGGHSVVLSATAQRLLGLDQETHRPRAVARGLDAAARRMLFSHLRQAIQAGRQDLFTEIAIRQRPIVISGALAFENGRLARLSGSVADASQRHELERTRRMERELRTANAAAERAMADRSRLFAATNHDLRQPLQSLGLFIELTHGRATDAQILRWTEQMRAAHLSLSDTLDGLLALSRLESGAIEPHMQAVALDDLLARLAGEYAEVAAGKGLALSAMPTRHHALTDRRLLKRILRNLIVNAVRYTDTGRIVIGCRGRGPRVAIQVWDTGPGIEPADQQSIFEEFRQAEAGRRAASGIGLGLAIVHGLTQLLDAQVQLRSVPGRGSMFEVVVARANQADVLRLEANDSVSAERLDGLSLLVLEDEAVLRDAMADFLRERGARVTAVADGTGMRSALAEGLLPDLAIVDYRLGGSETGLDCLRILRERIPHPVPALVVTGEARGAAAAAPDDVQVLRKPVAPAELVAAIRKQAGREAAT